MHAHMDMLLCVHLRRFQKLRKKAGVTPLDPVEFFYGECGCGCGWICFHAYCMHVLVIACMKAH